MRAAPLSATVLRPISAFVAFGMYWGGWATMLPDVARATHLTDGELGRLMMCTILGAVPAMRLGGRAADSPGVPLLAASVAALAVTMPAAAFATVPWALTLALVLAGAASGVLDVLMNTAASEFELAQGRRRMHLIHATYSAGLCAASITAGALRQMGLNYHVVLLLDALAVLALSLLARRGKAGGAPPPYPSAVPDRQQPAAKRRILFQALSWPLLGLGLVCAVAFVAENGMELWSAMLLERELHAPLVVGGLGPGLLAAAATLGRMTAQTLAARLGEALLLLSAGILTTLGVAGFTLASSWPFALPPLLLAGGGVAVAAPTVISMAGRLGGPAGRGASVSTVTQIAYAGFLIAPLGLGALSDRVGLRLALTSLGGCALGYGLGGFFLMRRLRRSVAPAFPG